MSTKNKFETIQDFIDLFTRLKSKYSADEKVTFYNQDDDPMVIDSILFEQKEYEPEFIDPDNDDGWYENCKGVKINLELP
jgi:hypothetical protein